MGRSGRFSMSGLQFIDRLVDIVRVRPSQQGTIDLYHCVRVGRVRVSGLEMRGQTMLPVSPVVGLLEPGTALLLFVAVGDPALPLQLIVNLPIDYHAGRASGEDHVSRIGRGGFSSDVRSDGQHGRTSCALLRIPYIEEA